MNEIETAGYGDRLKVALRKGPQPMSVRGLAKELRSLHPDLPGNSYGGVRQYVEGKIQTPRIDLLRAMAEVLEVRPGWLAFDEGEPTEKEERARQAREEAAEAVTEDAASDRQRWFIDVVGGRFLRSSGSFSLAAHVAILEAWERLDKGGIGLRWHVEPTPPAGQEDDFLRWWGLEEDARVPETKSEGSAVERPGRNIVAYLRGEGSIPVPEEIPEERRRHYAIAKFIGHALRGPFAFLPLEPSDLPGPALSDFVVTVCQGLHRIAEAPRLRPEYIPEPDGTSPPATTTTEE